MVSSNQKGSGSLHLSCAPYVAALDQLQQTLRQNHPDLPYQDMKAVQLVRLPTVFILFQRHVKRDSNLQSLLVQEINPEFCMCSCLLILNK